MQSVDVDESGKEVCGVRAKGGGAGGTTVVASQRPARHPVRDIPRLAVRPHRHNLSNNKRGIMFSITILLLLAIIITIVFVQSQTRARDREEVVFARVSALDHFVRDVKADLERGARIAGHRSILALTEEVASTGRYISDVDASFTELFLNGTLNGLPRDLVQNETFTDWTERVSAKAATINVDFGVELGDVTIMQVDPWSVRVRIESTMHVRDVNDLARWDTDREVVADISIRGFEDPLYAAGTNGLLKNNITEANNTEFVSGGNPGVLLKHINQSLYTRWSGAPSFLNRIAGDFTASPYGIESLVNVNRLIDVGAELHSGKSIVDYIYFGPSSPSASGAPGLPSWALMDDQASNLTQETHWQKYEYDELVTE